MKLISYLTLIYICQDQCSCTEFDIFDLDVLLHFQHVEALQIDGVQLFTE